MQVKRTKGHGQGQDGKRRKREKTLYRVAPFEGQDKDFVLDMGAYWEPAEGKEERCHIV